MALHYSPNIVTNGLVLALDASDPKSYSGSGTVWTDRSGNGNNGTLVNDVGYNSANNGSLTFDGVNDYISLNSILSAKPFCISFWVKLTSLKNQSFYTSRTILGHGISIFALGLTGSNTIRFDTGDVTNQWATGYAPTLNVWTNLTLQVTDSEKQLYVNGNFLTSISFTSSVINISPTIATIGVSQINGFNLDNYISGNIGKYLVYNRALSASEIAQNFNATRSRFNI
jgi:hypothetical protein